MKKGHIISHCFRPELEVNQCFKIFGSVDQVNVTYWGGPTGPIYWLTASMRVCMGFSLFRGFGATPGKFLKISILRGHLKY